MVAYFVGYRFQFTIELTVLPGEQRPPRGRLGVSVDTSDWANLWGMHFAQRPAYKTQQS